MNASIQGNNTFCRTTVCESLKLSNHIEKWYLLEILLKKLIKCLNLNRTLTQMNAMYIYRKKGGFFLKS
jgi:hypothetical protein